MTDEQQECNDPNCSGLVELDGSCLICGEEQPRPCPTCEGIGVCARSCPEREAEPDLEEVWP